MGERQDTPWQATISAHTWELFSVTTSPNRHVFGLWEEAREPTHATQCTITPPSFIFFKFSFFLTLFSLIYSELLAPMVATHSPYFHVDSFTEQSWLESLWLMCLL